MAAISAEDKRSLRIFKRLAGMHGGIGVFAHTDGCQTEYMRQLKNLTPNVSRRTIGTFEHKLKTGEETVDSLVAKFKLEELTINDDEDDSEDEDNEIEVEADGM